MSKSNSNSDSISDSDSDGSKSKDYESHLQNSSSTVMDMLSHGQLSQAILHCYWIITRLSLG